MKIVYDIYKGIKVGFQNICRRRHLFGASLIPRVAAFAGKPNWTKLATTIVGCFFAALAANLD